MTMKAKKLARLRSRERRKAARRWDAKHGKQGWGRDTYAEACFQFIKLLDSKQRAEVQSFCDAYVRSFIGIPPSPDDKPVALGYAMEQKVWAISRDGSIYADFQSEEALNQMWADKPIKPLDRG